MKINMKNLYAFGAFQIAFLVVAGAAGNAAADVVPGVMTQARKDMLKKQNQVQANYDLERQIGYAEYHLKEFENEVALQRGGDKKKYRAKQDALRRIRALKEQYPDNPRVEELFVRMRTALMKSRGDFTEVDPKWTQYLQQEAVLRKQISGEGESFWNALLAEKGASVLPKTYPAPNSEEMSAGDLKGVYVVLDDVEYPARQFYGASGEYVACGKPSSGFYFLKISGRDWIGPYEAVKRYRRTVDPSMSEVKTWKVLGEIVSIASENPNPSEEGTGDFQYGWVVKPVALMVPGHVAAVADKSAESGGRFIGEEKVEAAKQSWYTIKEIPEDVTPEKLAEIFMLAIKEKNYRLYCACIDPKRQETQAGRDLLKYHWDLHQERFHGEYIHASFGPAVVEVRDGFDENNDDENFFLTAEQKAALIKSQGEKVETAKVESKAYDKNGKQLGTPHSRMFIRRGGGRWYVDEYEPRF